MEYKNQEEFEFVEEQVCSQCKEEKPLVEFSTRGGGDIRLRAQCKVCRCMNQKEYYKENIDKERTRGRLQRELRQQIVLEYTKAHPCIVCGETDPLVLEFDHRDRSTKSFNISDGCVQKRALTVLREEMGKCDILCANCHRRKTAKQLGFYSYRVLHGEQAEMVE